jgi:fructosamine-3-kinase
MTPYGNTRPIDIIHELARVMPSNKKELIDEIKVAIGSCLIRTVDSHNTSSILFVFQDPEVLDDNKYVLKAEYGPTTATGKEINWYSKTKTYDFIPRLISSSVTATHSLLLLAYVEGAQTLDNLSNDVSPATILAYYKDAVEFDRRIYHDSVPRKSRPNEMDKFYIDKFNKRYKESMQYDYLKQLLNKDLHIVNGKQYYSPGRYIEMINENSALREHLMPNELGRIHGDLHGGNILLANNHLYLVDPNGDLEMPLEYDYGKVLHTVHGEYPAIMNESYVLDQNHEGFIFELKTVKNAVYPGIKKFLDDTELIRGLYAEAMHFATMLPHHANNRQETTALFLRTVELFDELYYDMLTK